VTPPLGALGEGLAERLRTGSATVGVLGLVVKAVAWEETDLGATGPLGALPHVIRI
jgi:hypothetical protein